MPPLIYFRTLKTQGRGDVTPDSFMRFTTSLANAKVQQTFLQTNYGVQSDVIPIAIELQPGADIEVSLEILEEFDAVISNTSTNNSVIIRDTSLLPPALYTAKELTTTITAEGSNLYFTEQRARAALYNATSPIPLGNQGSPTLGDNTGNIATTGFVQSTIAALVDAAPTTLNTLNELAAALGDDANFATTIADSVALKANTSSLSTVATTGQYTDVIGTPTLAAVALSGSYNDLSATPALHAVALSGQYSALINAPTLHAVALSGSYTDLTNVPAAGSDASYVQVTAFATHDTEMDTGFNAAGVSRTLGYVANTSANYTNAATSLLDADNKLDTQIKTVADSVTALATVATTGSYTDLINIPTPPAPTFAALIDKPTTISGYGITDAFDGAFTSLTATPTTIAGYGITDSAPTFAEVTHKPTTISGYGITDAVTSSSATVFTNKSGAISQWTNDAGYITAAGVTSNVVSDTTPQLGGDLDGQHHTITNVTIGDSTEFHGNILLTGTATSHEASRTIDFTGFDKEGTTDFTDRAYIRHTVGVGGHANTVLEISSLNDAADGIAFTTHANSLLRHNGNAIYSEGHKPEFSEITSTPTTIAGYGITDSPSTGNMGIVSGTFVKSTSGSITHYPYNTSAGSAASWASSDFIGKSYLMWRSGHDETQTMVVGDSSGGLTVSSSSGNSSYPETWVWMGFIAQ